MESYRHRESPLHFVAAFLVCAILVGFSVQNRLSWLQTPLTSVTTPVRAPLLGLRFRIEQYVDGIKQLPYQYRLIKDLERKNAQLAVTAQKVTDLEQENTTLRAALKAPIVSGHKLLPARVLSVARNAIIDQGSNGGVQAGQAIVVGDTYLGKVLSTTNRTARIQLVNDPDIDLSAITLSGTLGTVDVKNNQLQIDQVLQKDNLKAEEPVFTRGGESIPAQLLVGTISKIDANPAGVYKSAIISPAITVSDQSVVLVILE